MHGGRGFERGYLATLNLQQHTFRYDVYHCASAARSCAPLDRTSTQGRNWGIQCYVLQQFKPFYPGSVETPENTRITITGNQNIAQRKTNRSTTNYNI